MLKAFATWLNDTGLSLIFKTTSWLVPLSQSVHILAVAIVLSSFVLLAMRASGVTGRDVRMTQLQARFLPWVWVSIVVLLLTGILQIIAEPARALLNPFFQAKMALIVAVVFIVRSLQTRLNRALEDWDVAERLPISQRIGSAAIVVLTLIIIFCGRWIAYSDAPR